MSDPLVILNLTLRILLGVALGASIGLERQWGYPRATGIRTNALVSAGSALFVIVGADGLAGAGIVGADPTRVAAQIVSGIGFLGAGVIIRDGFSIRGLTTAATLWCAAAIGSLAGAGLPWLAVIGSVAIIGTNVLLRPLGRLVNRRNQRELDLADTDTDADIGDLNEYSLEVVTAERSQQRVRALTLQEVSRSELMLRSFRVTSKSGSRKVLRVIVSMGAGYDTSVLEEAVSRIGIDPEVSSSRWKPIVVDAYE